MPRKKASKEPFPLNELEREDLRAMSDTDRARENKRLGEKMKLLETRALFHEAAARRQLIAIAHDLLPAAAGLARKGKPRLLAVVSKVILSKTHPRRANPSELLG